MLWRSVLSYANQRAELAVLHVLGLQPVVGLHHGERLMESNEGSSHAIMTLSLKLWGKLTI
jgi:hypothetical protein